ncbi:MAG: sensor histidine kinase [Pseudomonadales bacterium]
MSMPKPNPRPIERRDQARAGYFVLPDLCKVQPLFVLIVTAQLLVLVQTLLLGPVSSFDWAHFATASFYVQWNVLLCAAVLCKFRERIQRMPITPGALVAYGLILFISFLLSVVAQWLVHSYLSRLPGPWRWDWQATASQLAVVAVIGGIALRYMYLQQQVLIQGQARLQAQIHALQSRIRPHFLFNSMNIVASLISTDPKRAERVVEDISELFRASLRAGDDLVAVREEVDLCKQYISIEQLRLGDRLQVDWQLDDALMDASVPSLTLQPIIENAVYHGIQPLVNGGTVQIVGSKNGDDVSLVVSNPLPEQTEFDEKELPRGNRIALANTIARLRAHFGPDANVKTFNDGYRFSAEISYSVKK